MGNIVVITVMTNIKFMVIMTMFIRIDVRAGTIISMIRNLRRRLILQFSMATTSRRCRSRLSIIRCRIQVAITITSAIISMSTITRNMSCFCSLKFVFCLSGQWAGMRSPGVAAVRNMWTDVGRRAEAGGGGGAPVRQQRGGN